MVSAKREFQLMLDNWKPLNEVSNWCLRARLQVSLTLKATTATPHPKNEFTSECAGHTLSLKA